jgi:hypothetical protein
MPCDRPCDLVHAMVRLCHPHGLKRLEQTRLWLRRGERKSSSAASFTKALGGQGIGRAPFQLLQASFPANSRELASNGSVLLETSSVIDFRGNLFPSA